MRLGKLTKHMNTTFNSDGQTEGETIDQYCRTENTCIIVEFFPCLHDTLISDRIVLSMRDAIAHER